MLKLLKKLRRDERGNILIITAAAMPLIVGSAGLAVDTIQWTLWKRQLQRAADSAALAGVYERKRAKNVAGVPDAVQIDLGRNQQTGLTLAEAMPAACPVAATPAVPVTNMPLYCPPDETTGGVARKYQVQVTLKISQAPTFSSMFMSGPMVISATARAASVASGGEYCVVGLDTRANKTAVSIGGSTTVDMGACSLMSNSTNPSAAATNVGSSANSRVVAASIAAVGGVAYSNRWTVGSYEPGTPAVQDPLGPGGNRPLTVPSTCDTTVSSIANGANRTATDAPTAAGVSKVVCVTGGFTVQGNVTLGAATYVIDGGDLQMNANGASLTCNGCTIILTNKSNPANPGNIQITGGTLDITPPSTGLYRGIAIYQDRNATDDNGNSPQNRINGNTNSKVQGVVYTPGRSLSMLGGGTASAPVCLQVLGKRVEFTGNSYIQIASRCSGLGMDAIEAEPLVRLVA